MLNAEHWLTQLAALVARFNGLGLEDDMGTLDIDALWGLYLRLTRLSEF